ncbi:MAG: BtpA/SgcQ family protein [Lewinella sp.]|nr:BtpA/SgcQ family protein [Lewinella sp.]
MQSPIPFTDLFPSPYPLIAMIHLGALPGTPAYAGSMRTIVEQAAAEAKLLAAAGVDGLLIENMHDTPYLRRAVGPEITAAMTMAAQAVRAAAPQLPIGIQVLAGANRAALAVALAAELQFVRAEGFVFGHVADEGWLDSDAGELLRYRRAIGAAHIPVYTDIKKKHSAHAATADVSLAETAHAAAFFRTDGLIVTGQATGETARPEDLTAVKAACPELPLLVGSGIRPDNVAQYHVADGFIVGSALKKDGHWANAIEAARVNALVKATFELRENIL